ncbi:hypothetical protein AOLI_G00248370 [Acnodon oligacanthus]
MLENIQLEVMPQEFIQVFQTRLQWNVNVGEHLKPTARDFGQFFQICSRQSLFTHIIELQTSVQTRYGSSMCEVPRSPS